MNDTTVSTYFTFTVYAVGSFCLVLISSVAPLWMSLIYGAIISVASSFAVIKFWK